MIPKGPDSLKHPGKLQWIYICFCDQEFRYDKVECNKSMNRWRWRLSPLPKLLGMWSWSSMTSRPKKTSVLSVISPVFLFPKKSVWKISGLKKDCMMKLRIFVQRAKPWGPASLYPSNSHHTFWVWDPNLNLQSPPFMRHPSIHPFPKKKDGNGILKKSLDQIPGHHQYQQWYQHWIGSKAQTCHESTAPFV